MDIIKNLYLHKYTHKMFYKSRQNNSTTTSSAPRRSSGANNAIRAQQFYIYTVDSTARNSNPPAALDLPPKYDDVIKEPYLYRTREVA